MRLRDWLDQGEAQLAAGPHPDRARRDAETLLQHHIGKNRAWLLAHADDEYAGCSAIGYAAMLKRRAAGEPIQYITGECEFYGLPFRVTPAVLIPRPETEFLVERAIHLIPALDKRSKKFFSFSVTRNAFGRGKSQPRPGDPKETGFPPRVLDIGTGSGCIAISILHDWGNAEVTAIDVSASALEVARANAERLRWDDCIRFLQGDLLAPVAGETFDLIVSNPPYVASADRETLAVEVRDHEPGLALFAGNDGLAVYRRLIPDAFGALAHGGYLALEIGFGQSEAIRGLFESAGFTNIEFTPDLQGILRVAFAQRP